MKTNAGATFHPTSYITRAPRSRRRKTYTWLKTTESTQRHILTISQLPVGWWLLWK